MTRSNSDCACGTMERVLIQRSSLGHGSERHYGLRGMRERTTLIGGKLVVWSEVDAGTELELRVSGDHAYETGRRASWLSKKFSEKTEHEVGDRS